MNQTLAHSTFAGGLVLFLSTIAEILGRHSSWAEFTTTPAGVGHLCLLAAAFVSLVFGALGVQLPRATAPYGDRATDPKPAPAPVPMPTDLVPPAA